MTAGVRLFFTASFRNLTHKKERLNPDRPQSQPPITHTTHTLPFDNLSPRDFERLCLGLVERERYQRAEHLGAAVVQIQRVPVGGRTFLVHA